MTKRLRRSLGTSFKATAALEAFKEQQTLTELAGVHLFWIRDQAITVGRLLDPLR